MNLWDAFLFVLKGIGGVTLTARFSQTGYRKETHVPPKYRYFKPEEVEGLNEEFVAKLDQARHLAGFPFVITSGFRTPEKNQSIPGSVSDSSHIKGLAVDLRVSNSHEVALICDAAKAVGITRRCIYVDKEFQAVHIHLDVDPDKPDEIIRVYPEPKSWAQDSAPATA